MSSVTATVREGALRGKVTTTHTGKTYYSFQGIPYAKPPVGPLRFKPPEPAEPWAGVRDATKEGNVAPQFSDATRQYMGDEDCLFLNVYTPQMPSDSSSAVTPVMVWIHGGGYTVGSGNTDMFGPDYLLEHGVVVVTLNYRLGVLGFMSTGDSVVTGNMGLKDQVTALRWVKDNISVFGGDTDNITIFGESAGSRACHLHVLSPVAKGLFHRAICQSSVASRGSLDAPVAERTFRLAHHLGLKQGASSEELLAFMKEVPARKLVEEMMHCRSQKDKTLQEIFPFRPTLEPAGAEGTLITEDPADIISSGKFTPVPIIFGVTSQEGLLYAGGAAHADDIPYLFRFGLRNPSPPNSVEGRVIARMTKLWTNFAKTGNPTPGGDEIIPVSWPAVSADHCQHLEITNDGLAIKENLFKERMDFWNALHKKKAGVKSSS
ncbi:esterase E4-like isoform X2 [Schistocerca nitens]|uniref:esterase E4-like isoform X2 n=1 Tax=Schistocerca nitens TaxID=7011 RepID=UPI002117AFBD|nr:esterase E4-like isoform X2 [Schistocerca nitens]